MHGPCNDVVGADAARKNSFAVGGGYAQRRHRVSGHMSTLVFSSLLTIAASLPLMAQEVHSFNVRSTDPASAIRALSDQAGIQILASADDLRGKRFHAIKGSISTEEALNKMLDGTGIGYRYVGDRAVALVSHDNREATNKRMAANARSSAAHTKGEADKGRKVSQSRTATSREQAGSDPQEETSGRPEDALVLQEVTVTARKRRESIQDVPISITSVDADFIKNNNITAVSQIARFVPNTYMSPTDAVGSTLGAYIRGIGNRTSEPTQDQAVVESIDGVYLTSLTDSALGIFDVANMEVDGAPKACCRAGMRRAGRSI